MTTVHVATLNIRNLADRWAERQSLIFAEMAALQPDVLGLQEVVYPLQQDRLIGAAGEARYDAHRGWAGRPEYGNSLLVREPLEATDFERADLGSKRSALRGVLTLDGGARLLVAVTHLHHIPDDEDERLRQVGELVRWLEGAPAADGRIVVGDFNAEPVEPAYAAMAAAGYRSAHSEANGTEPAVTWPSGLQAPMVDDEGDPGCLDYIWVGGAVRVESCRVVFDRPAVGDATL
ncbi:MAG TPA: endonuclease/exonuclease/phosphatase family protein, partial [Candidatus Limnocylindrales bacterium]|nr:endonuclease/exonuclease/phosphatase family protein [Candidatus Limnocylindrales bacterium]